MSSAFKFSFKYGSLSIKAFLILVLLSFSGINATANHLVIASTYSSPYTSFVGLGSLLYKKFVKKNSEDKRKARQKRVIVDEAWMLLPFPEAVDFLNKMARRARKRNVSLAIISQRFQDFYEKPEAQAVLTSSDTKLFLAQDKSEIQQLKEVFKLSEGEASFLVTCSKGEGLLKVGQDTAVIQITPTRKEFEFVETNMNKLVANNQRDDQRNINKN